MSKPSVFLSYSHLAEKWKDQLLDHLAPFAREGLFDLWDDRRIAALGLRS